MKAVALTIRKIDEEVQLFGLCALLIAFLFFMDEGYYDFRWVASPGNWVAYFIYLIPVYFSVLGISKLNFIPWPDWLRISLSFVLGSSLGLWLVISWLTN